MTDTENLWQYPNCDRFFAKKNQDHASISYSVDAHFRSKTDFLKEIFARLVAETSKFKAVRIDTVRPAINLARNYHFAVIYVLRNSLQLDFTIDSECKDERIIRTEKLGENKYIHCIRLSSKESLDVRMLDWLKEAYHLTG